MQENLHMVLGLCRVTAVTVLLSIPSIAGAQAPAIDYPDAARDDVVDEYHGVRVPDPYRWLETAESEAAQAWIAQQESLLNGYLAADAELRAEIERRIAEVTSFATRSTPNRKGDRAFHSESAAGEPHSVLFVTEGDAEPRVLFDPSRDLPSDYRFNSFTPTPDGRYGMLRLQRNGAPFQEVRFLDVEGGNDHDDVIHDSWGSPSWLHDGSGFFYSRFPARESDTSTEELGNPSIWFHELGTEQSADVLVYDHEAEDSWLLRKSVTYDGRYLLIQCARGSDFSGLDDVVLIVDLDADDSTPRLLVEGEDGGRWRYVDHRNGRVFMRTTDDAPNGRIVSIDLENGERREVVPEREWPLATVSAHPDRLGLGYLKHGRTEVTFVDHDGEVLGQVALPGNVSGLPTDRDRYEVEFGISSLYDPGSQVRFDVRTGEMETTWQPELAHDPSQFDIRQVFYRSSDGTRVPMWVAGRHDVLARREPAPLFMYAYGALGWSAFPWYQAHLVVWMERGGLYALPGIRGGGEYGDSWWEAGRRRNRPNAIADVVAAAEFLCEAGYTSPDHLVGDGGSASGVIVGAAMMQRPDLFAAGLIEVPKLDLLRHHLFTGSSFSSGDVGTSEDPGDFRVLASYSPVHNVRAGVDYPAMLVTVGENDGTCPPLHGLKFVAEMQATSTSSRPAMLLWQRETGHGWGNTPEARARHQSAALAFLFKQMPRP